MPKIKIIDDLPPEDIAMLQALYSRSPASVDDHLEKVKASGSGKFMGRYYVGYNHASIGDCGTTTIFIEGVSMLAAKAIQDWPLYSGQEASTRYMDFGSVPFGNPAGSYYGEQTQARWRAFYLDALPQIRDEVRARHPLAEGEDEDTYARAVAARAFDVARGFLPAGATTNLSWTTNLRQARDKLTWLRAHPDVEVRLIGVQLYDELKSRYPHSFSADRSVPAVVDNWRSDTAHDAHSTASSYTGRAARMPSLRVHGKLDIPECAYLRPKGAELPPWTAGAGQIQSTFLLDYGSYRDLQRHRNGTIRVPFLDTQWGFHPWYLEQLPERLAGVAMELLQDQRRAIATLGCTSPERQHYVPLGYRIPCRVIQSLPGFIYRVELRSAKTVHPTLREIVLAEAAWFRKRFSDVPLYVDTDPDSWTVRRGKQTITEKV